tara:strand:- start:445 stop:1152 length:708 start_codon:yes stop_codon:yes gene_type:complete
MTKKNLTEDVKPSRISSAYVNAPFDEGKAELERNGYRVISLEEAAKLRMERGLNSKIADDGFWVKEGMLYVPNKGIYITKNSPVMAYPEMATQAHRTGSDFYLREEEVEKALEDSIQLPPHSIKIPTDRFRDDALAFYLFGNQAEKYGDHLYNETDENSEPIDKIIVHVDDKSFKETEHPFARQIYLDGLGHGSDIYGDGRNFHSDGPLTLYGMDVGKSKSYFDIRGIKEVEKNE